MRPAVFRSLPPLVLLLSLSGYPRAQTGQTTLQPGNVIDREIGPTESHGYTISLSAEQFLQFVVYQHGIDLTVRVFSPAGKSLGEFDTSNGAEGPENVSLVALNDGAYRIVVAPLEPSNTQSGRYEIKTLELRQATDQELKVGKNEEARRIKGLALLSDIVDSIPEIRLPQTRVRVKLQSAALLWSVDEKKAAQLLTEGLNESKDYLATLKEDDDAYEEAQQWMRQLRYEAVQTLALRDPEAALNLFLSSRRPLNSEGNRGEEEQERQFEVSLASQIAAKNPKRAFALAEESLKRGYSPTLITTLRLLRRQDQDLAANLAKNVVSKLLGEKLLINPEAADLALNLIRSSLPSSNPDSNATRGNSPPLLPPQDFKVLVQRLLNEALAATSTRDELRKGGGSVRLLLNLKGLMGAELDSLIPGATIAISRKIAEFGPEEPWQVWQRYEDSIENASSAEAAKETIAQAPPELRSHLLQRLVERNLRLGDFAQAKQLIAESLTNPRARRQAFNNLERQAAQTDISLGRIEDALKHIGKLEPVSERAQVISEIASRIGPGQKRGQALALLETARSLIGTSIQAEGQPQMNALLQLAGAFSRHDSKRGFEIVEPLVDQFNDLSQAARTMNGFGPQYFVDGELSMQNGNSLASIANQLAITLGILSLTDFDRARTTSDRLILPEVRLSVYLGIAQQAIMPNGLYSPSAVYLNSLYR